eukprot:1856418-Prymnesium_polylepis.1
MLGGMSRLHWARQNALTWPAETPQTSQSAFSCSQSRLSWPTEARRPSRRRRSRSSEGGELLQEQHDLRRRGQRVVRDEVLADLGGLRELEDDYEREQCAVELEVALERTALHDDALDRVDLRVDVAAERHAEDVEHCLDVRADVLRVELVLEPYYDVTGP